MRSEFTRGLAEDSFKHPVELSQRLKTNVVGDLAYAAVGIQKLTFGIFQTHACNVIGKLEAGCFLKDFTEVKNACARGLCHHRQRKRLHLVLLNVPACLPNQWWL